MSRPIPIEEMVAVYKKNHKNSHLFKIDKFSSLIKYDIERIESSVFVVCGLKWKIIVTFDKDKDYVSIFLENQAAIHDELKYQVYVVSQLKPEWHPKKNVKWDFGTSLKKKQKGIINLMSLDDLKSKGYLIDDCCMFGATLPDLEPARPGTAECFSLIEKPLPYEVTLMVRDFFCFDPETDHQSKEFVVGNRKW